MSILTDYFEAPQAGFLPKSPEWERWVLWQLRNPLSKQLKEHATDKIPDQPTFNPDGGWLYLEHKSGLPFVSYRGPLMWPMDWVHVEIYEGWRPNGIFGLAFRKAFAGDEKTAVDPLEPFRKA